MALALTTATSPAKPGRNLMLYVVLIITLGLTAWMKLYSTDESDAIVVVHQPKASQQTSLNLVISVPTKNNISAVETNLIVWHALKRQPMTNSPQDLFKVHSWFVPPPVKKTAFTPQPPAVAPQVPFNYMGKMEDSPKGMLFFLVANNKLYSVVKGEKVNQQWRLDAEDANTLMFTYLPLNLAQVLLKSSNNAMVPAAAKLPTESNL